MKKKLSYKLQFTDSARFMATSLSNFVNTQVSRLPRTFANNSSAKIKLSKLQLSKIE